MNRNPADQHDDDIYLASAGFNESQQDDNAAHEQFMSRLESVASRREKSLLACDYLFYRKGVRPSAAKVHSLIAQGSLSDIQKDVNVWWARLRKRAGESNLNGVPFPDDVARQFEQALSQMWELATEHVEGHLAAERQKLADREREIKALLEAERKLRGEAESQLSGLRQALESQRQASMEREAEDHARIKALESEIAQIRTQIEQDRANSAQIQQALNEQIAKLENERDVLIAEKERDRQYLEGQINFTLRQIDEAREAMKREREYAEQIEQMHRTEIERLERRYEQQIAEMKQIFDRQMSDYRLRLKEQESRVERIGVELAKKAEECIELERQVKMLEQEILAIREADQGNSVASGTGSGCGLLDLIVRAFRACRDDAAVSLNENGILTINLDMLDAETEALAERLAVLGYGDVRTDTGDTLYIVDMKSVDQ